MGFKDPSCKVKNTFLEFSAPEDGEQQRPVEGRRRARSDMGSEDATQESPLVVASKSPTSSPALQPVDERMQAVPIDEVDFELLEEAAPMGSSYPTMSNSSRFDQNGDSVPTAVAQSSPGLGRDEPAYVVPTTPSPFLHSAFPPSVVPPFGYANPYAMTEGMDLGLPPAVFGGGEEGYEGQEVEGHCQYMQDAEGNYIQMPDSMYQMPEMYDPSCSPFLPYGWGGMTTDGSGYAEGMIPTGPEGVFDPSMAQEMACGDQGMMGDSQPSAGRKRGKGKKKNKDAEEEVYKTGETMSSPPKASAKDQAESKGPGAAQYPDLQEGEEYTTVMLRNIPNKYTREMLIKQLQIDFNGLFDFMYLPIDFKNKCNVGYGFINFRNQEACERFVENFHGVDVRKCLPGLNSKKIVEVTPARVQGLIENVRRLKNSPVMNQLQDHPEWMPLLFDERGNEEPFPNPDQALPPVKPRGRAKEAKDS